MSEVVNSEAFQQEALRLKDEGALDVLPKPSAANCTMKS